MTFKIKKELLSPPPRSPKTKHEPDASASASTSALTRTLQTLLCDDFTVISDDEDDEPDNIEDGVVSHSLDTGYFVKQEFIDPVPASLPLLDEFHQDLVNSFSLAIGGQVHITTPEACCSTRHGEIRFIVYDFPSGIEWLDIQAQTQEVVANSRYMMGYWISADGNINIHMAKDAFVASTSTGSSSGYMIADESTVQTCILTMEPHNCNGFLHYGKEAWDEYQTLAYILSTDVRLNPHDITRTLRFLSDRRVRMKDITCE